MTVHALSDDARAFYEKVGFDPSPLAPHLLLITLSDLIGSFEILEGGLHRVASSFLLL